MCFCYQWIALITFSIYFIDQQLKEQVLVNRIILHNANDWMKFNNNCYMVYVNGILQLISAWGVYGDSDPYSPRYTVVVDAEDCALTSEVNCSFWFTECWSTDDVFLLQNFIGLSAFVYSSKIK